MNAAADDSTPPRNNRDRGQGMKETCDRCGPAVRAAYRACRDGELYFCRHCANQLSAALSARGWTMWRTEEHVLALQTA